MKTSLIKATTFMLFMVLAQGIWAQDFCLWIVNNRPETLNELRVKNTKSNIWSNDLLPYNTIESGKAYWIRVTNWDNDLGDVQITTFDSGPLLFYVKDVYGDYRDFDYLRLDFRNIHTLVLNQDRTFSIYNTDRFGLGHPCQY